MEDTTEQSKPISASKVTYCSLQIPARNRKLKGERGGINLVSVNFTTDL